MFLEFLDHKIFFRVYKLKMHFSKEHLNPNPNNIIYLQVTAIYACHVYRVHVLLYVRKWSRVRVVRYDNNMRRGKKKI